MIKLLIELDNPVVEDGWKISRKGKAENETAGGNDYFR